MHSVNCCVILRKREKKKRNILGSIFVTCEKYKSVVAIALRWMCRYIDKRKKWFLTSGSQLKDFTVSWNWKWLIYLLLGTNRLISSRVVFDFCCTFPLYHKMVRYFSLIPFISARAKCHGILYHHQVLYILLNFITFFVITSIDCGCRIIKYLDGCADHINRSEGHPLYLIYSPFYFHVSLILSLCMELCLWIV